ncbi:ubiquitin-conjugating enzyme/RWD-like protein [Jimgerdemannia flammicorona]|uniref:NEDD8-conjugating enzyme UBC12 n=1 Tax=Jimgerdemannia flammicorona TaxID=994334 RepID=A0A433D5Y9_9FUNG|nr:ubiquitin-conjugating enzyme/RWD-like protein [Jimgerdemannia flammicorona]
MEQTAPVRFMSREVIKCRLIRCTRGNAMIVGRSQTKTFCPAPKHYLFGHFTSPHTSVPVSFASYQLNPTFPRNLQSDEAAAEKKKPKTSAAQIRVQKDLNELEIPKTIVMDFPEPSDILNFNVTIAPDEGFYKGGVFRFTFAINNNYPHEPPKVRCTQKIYHPNIDLDGNICLNILREDWKPVLNLHSVLVGLQYLFLEPNADDPLNKGTFNIYVFVFPVNVYGLIQRLKYYG